MYSTNPRMDRSYYCLYCSYHRLSVPPTDSTHPLGCLDCGPLLHSSRGKIFLIIFFQSRSSTRVEGKESCRNQHLYRSFCSWRQHAALLARNRTQKGQKIDCSLLETQILWWISPVINWLAGSFARILDGYHGRNFWLIFKTFFREFRKAHRFTF